MSNEDNREELFVNTILEKEKNGIQYMIPLGTVLKAVLGIDVTPKNSSVFETTEKRGKREAVNAILKDILKDENIFEICVAQTGVVNKNRRIINESAFGSDTSTK